MEKKKYLVPQTEVLKIDGCELLNGLIASGTGDDVVINPNGEIGKGNATTAASKPHFNLWDWDAEDFEDDEDEKKNN